MEKDIFPLFRKYSHDRSFFKIVSKDCFVQLDIIGDAYFLHTFRAKIHPDRMLILDMINNENNAWQEIDEAVFEERLDHARKNLREM